MNIYERMEEIIRDGEATKKGRLLYGFTFDYDGDRLVKTDITMKDMCTMYEKMIDVLLIIKKALPVNVYNEMTENRCTLFDFISAYKKYEVV